MMFEVFFNVKLNVTNYDNFNKIAALNENNLLVKSRSKWLKNSGKRGPKPVE